jgi:hypothetical protein
MNVIEFQEFLKQLVSLQAAGLDAQHLIDEADKGGYERGLKDAAVVVPPIDPGPVVPPVEGQIVMSQEELDAKLAEAKKAGSDEAIANDPTKFNDADVAKLVEEGKAPLKEKIAALELSLSQKDADALEEAIADELAAMAQKMRDRTVKPAPVEPVV